MRSRYNKILLVLNDLFDCINLLTEATLEYSVNNLWINVNRKHSWRLYGAKYHRYGPSVASTIRHAARSEIDVPYIVKMLFERET